MRLGQVDQAIALLTGMPAGDADASGKYPEGRVNRRVAARLAELFEIRKSIFWQAKVTAKKKNVEE
ncbi:hypothetical protein SCD_n02168 [Sulfuricella denitrificans skB26]|uniref:Uncharacterized protein n=1 Tax=Sulfuricella denitrificans (strain DSM 22764 / NBRC 105220 / skB26) TaxID=1163617 RepID=S6B631_SULDS|nr:hypothetical protein [Sulfuricella denitrificans]BAN35977.1 hypothetical protein SCD_n02168 [Sulfuricella denitrificans skB26]